MEAPMSPVMPCKMDLDKVTLSGQDDRDQPKHCVGLVTKPGERETRRIS